MSAQAHALETVSTNFANMRTVGYKPNETMFNTLLGSTPNFNNTVDELSSSRVNINVHERILGEDALELIMTAATDPAPELDAVPIERLRGVPMCLLRSDDLWGYNDYLMKECRRSGFEPNVPCQCYDTPMAMQLVRSGFGISFLPHSIVETHPNSGIYAKPLRGIPAKSYPVLVWSVEAAFRPNGIRCRSRPR